MNNSCIWCDAYGKCVALDDAHCPYLDQDCQDECEDYNGGSKRNDSIMNIQPFNYIITQIRCPECNAVQDAKIELTMPFWTYIHFCEKCGYVIMEDEWQEVKPF